METYTFTQKQDNLKVATPYNTRIILVRQVAGKEKVLLLPTAVNLIKYETRHITAPFRWLLAVPSHYALY